MTQYEPPFTTPEKAVDVVASISYRSDGTPAQTEGFVHLGAEPDALDDETPADQTPDTPAQA